MKKLVYESLEEFEWDKTKVTGKKIKPNKIVYHVSDKKFRNNILSKGLSLNVGDSYRDWVKGKSAIPAIFATNSDIDTVTGGISNFSGDIWEIHTDKINNDWFKDKHFDSLEQYGVSNPHIVTFNSIPFNAIRLTHKSV